MYPGPVEIHEKPAVKPAIGWQFHRRYHKLKVDSLDVRPSGRERAVTVITHDEIRGIVRNIATANLGSANVRDFLSESTTDVEGSAALKITIVLASESSAAAMSGDAILNTLVQIHDELLKEGDQRFPFIRYATKEDLQASVDDES
jgi:hypothetical protein